MVANSGLQTSLSTLVNALKTNQTSLSYLSDNISNVKTEGYSRRVVSQETQIVNGVGVGVNVSEVRRSIDESLLKSVRAQLSKTAEAGTINTYYDRMQNFTFGNPSSNYTINNSMSEFYSRLESFSNNPSSAVNRTLVINSATDLTNGLNELSTAVQNERYNADTDISTTVGDLNNILTNLGDINKALREAVGVGGDVQSLQDARDLQLNRLKEIVNANFTFDTYGQVAVNLSSTELLGFSTKYVVEYNRATSADVFKNGATVEGITVTNLNSAGQKTATQSVLLSASNVVPKQDTIPAGKLRALIDLRDTKLPAILSQLDTFAFTFADAFNEIHNSGTGYPPSTTITGTEAVKLGDVRYFTGQTRITLTDDTGQPVTGRYGTPVTPLVIDFDKLDGGDGFGTASVADIMREINSYYGSQPVNTASIGSANDIRLGAVSSSVASAKATGTVTLSGVPTDGQTVVINGSTVVFRTSPSAANEVQIGGNISNTVKNLEEYLNTTNDAGISVASYVAGGNTITVTAKNSGTGGNALTLAAGTSGAAVSGAALTGGADASGNFTFDFDFANLSPDGQPITFDVTNISVNGGAVNPVTFDTITQNAGDRSRTDKSGTANDNLTVNLTGLGLQEGSTFTVTATINIVGADGISKAENVTFTVTVPDPADDIKNLRYPATAISGSGDGTLAATTNTTPYMKATLVDANGTEVTDPTKSGFLKITTTTGSYRVSIDQLNSKEVGTYPATTGVSTGTNRGVSHYFGLNNFFDFGGTKTNAASNLEVLSKIVSSPALLSSGKVKQSVSTGTDKVYTYEVGAGSNDSVLELLALQDTNLKFTDTGTLPELTTTAGGYATEIYNFSATQANRAAAAAQQTSLLTESLKSKFDDISGVNIDEELAKTIEIQNAYGAAAKVLAIVKDLFSKLEEVVS